MIVNKIKATTLGAIVGGAVCVGAVAPAAAATYDLKISTITAVFQNSVPTNGVTLSGPGSTATAYWGTPATGSPGQSGYEFEAEATPIEVNADGSEFDLGIFRHINNPIYAPSLESIDLKLTFNTVQFGDFDTVYSFSHNETPNQKPCPGNNVSICDDIVTVTTNPAFSDQVTIGNETFYLAITGFQVGNNTFTDWLTREEATNEATLRATLTSELNTVPLPAAAWFMLTAIGGLFGSRWLKKGQSA
ncbi:THxN family PEP-CTERM protein [uncultured Rhodospira sp.]|uniref:THxN family PEP-CTERM protein n=1 Tax=uncultured Rhodospira sp. TaxID=1936189 RepID=UPI0026018375|nr:THxN family PEP-CTERM protein [uncultured Rhodospira sp.]